MPRGSAGCLEGSWLPPGSLYWSESHVPSRSSGCGTSWTLPGMRCHGNWAEVGSSKVISFYCFYSEGILFAIVQTKHSPSCLWLWLVIFPRACHSHLRAAVKSCNSTEAACEVKVNETTTVASPAIWDIGAYASLTRRHVNKTYITVWLFWLHFSLLWSEMK